MATGADSRCTAETGRVIGNRLNPCKIVPTPAFFNSFSTKVDDTLPPRSAPFLTRIGANTGRDSASKKCREKSFLISASDVKAPMIACSKGVNR